MKAEEDVSERTRNSIVTRSRGAIELKPHKPIVVQKQTRTISFNRVNHLFLSSLSFFFFSKKPAGKKWIALETQAFNSHYCGKIILQP